MTSSSIGFGHNPFGSNPWGIGDWAEEVLYRQTIPEFYKELDDAGPTGSKVQRPLRQFIDSLKPSFQDLLIRWTQFPDLWDALDVPLAQLPVLGTTVGINVDPTKLEGLQRSSVRNAVQLHINKGNDLGYEITAAFEGLFVTITPLWAETCARQSQTLGTIIGDIDVSFDLSTTPLELLPVSPATVCIQVSTTYGIEESIIDDGDGNLIGQGNQQNGSLTKLAITKADALTLSNIVGIISVGDTITQGPTTGTVVQIVNGTIKVLTTVGAFVIGAILDTTSGATADVDAVSVDTLQFGETIEGQTSGTTAVVRASEVDYALVDKISSGLGFTPTETLIGLTSNQAAIAGTSVPLVQGPLRHRLDLTGVAGVFLVDELITGGVSGATAFIREIDGDTLFVDVVTQPGFEVAELVTGGTSGATGTIDTLSQGTINYLTGELNGKTVPLAAGSTVSSVVKLVTEGPDQFIGQFDAIPGDIIPLDDVESNRFAKWPFTLIPVRVSDIGLVTLARCRSHKLNLFFFTPDDTEIEDFFDVAQRINESLERTRPIHVRFEKIRFDGSRASSQVWRTGALAVENSAAATWVVPVIANLQASSQVWIMPTLAATVAS